jgi:hypothetical protein
MTWSPGYKKNRFHVVNHMKIKDYQNYDSMREYYGVLNGQNPNKILSPRTSGTFEGRANPNAILANIQSGPQGPGPQVQHAQVRELRCNMSVGFTANLMGKAGLANRFKQAFSASYLIPDVQITKQ